MTSAIMRIDLDAGEGGIEDWQRPHYDKKAAIAMAGEDA
jgi:hypothetical protein